MSDTWNATWDKLITEMLRHMIREFLAHPAELFTFRKDGSTSAPTDSTCSIRLVTAAALPGGNDRLHWRNLATDATSVTQFVHCCRSASATVKAWSLRSAPCPNQTRFRRRSGPASMAWR
jgi:hypothetical protein